VGENAHNPTMQVTEPTLFVQPRAKIFVAMFWVIAAASAVCRGLYLLIQLAFGVHPSGGDIAAIVVSLLLVSAAGAALIVLAARKGFGWLRASAQTLDFAATGRKAISLPWSAVASVALRHRGAFTELVVTPTTMDAVTVAAGRGRRPWMRRRSGQEAFLVDVGLMSPGPEALLAELHRRIPAKV
jgi:hypothetical protein